MPDTTEEKAIGKSLVEGNVPVELPKGKLIIFIGSWIIFLAIGVGALMDIVGPEAAIIAGWLSLVVLSEITVPIIIMVVIAGGTIILTVWIIVSLLKNHAHGLLKFSIGFSTVLVWILFVTIVVLFGFGGETIILLIICVIYTILPILYFTIWKERVELAASILQLCGQVTHEEKELMVPGFLKVFFIGVFSAFGGLIAMDIAVRTIPAVDPPWYSFIPFIIFLFFLFFYIYINIYFFNALVTSISYIWYRKKDPKFMDGLTVAVYQLPDLALFAVFSSIIQLIRLFLRSRSKKTGSAPWTGDGFRLADGFISNIWFYVNYFTLPSIVIENVPATTAISRSTRRLFDNWVDVLLKQWGVSMVFNILQLVIILIFAMSGGLFGFVLATVYSMDMVVMVIIGVILFLFLSTLVSRPILNLYHDIYLTFLFGFILDKESSFKYENNLPQNLNDKFKAFFIEHPAVQRCSNCFARVPTGVRSCPKCGTAYP